VHCPFPEDEQATENSIHATWTVAHFDDQWDKFPKQKSHSKDSLKVLCSIHGHKSKEKTSRISFTKYAAGATRGKEGIEEITGAAIDIDDGTPKEAIIERLDALGLWYIIYSTTHHTPEFPRNRVIILFKSPLTPSQWEVAFDKINHHIFDGKADPSYRTDWQHLSNLPNCPKENKKDAFVITSNHDAALDPDDLPNVPKQTPPTTPQASNNGNGHHSCAVIKTPTKGREVYAQKVLETTLAKLSMAEEGERNIVLNRCSFTLGRWVGGGVFEYHDIAKQLEGVAVLIGMKHTEDNILETIESGLKSGMKKPKTIPPSKISYQGKTTISPPDAQPETTKAIEQEITIITGLPLDDIGNGQRFAKMHGHRLRHCSTKKSWMENDGRRWVKDESSEADRLAKITARSIINEADSEENDDKRERILKHAVSTFKNAKRKTMIEDAISEPGMNIKATDFDKDPYLFNVENGTLDLRTGELKPHNPDDLITKLANVVFNPNAQCPLFLEFLQKTFTGDTELIECMQRAFGYSLTGNTREQTFFIGYGGGSNGKSTLLQAVKRIMGDYAIEAEPATIMVQKQEKMATDIADLHNIRLVITSESNDTQRLDEAKIKKMTGGEDLTGERKFEHPFKFKPQFKLFLATNHLPTIRGTDHSIWRRIVTVPFNTKFWKDGEGDAGIPELKADPRFLEKLEAESSGILNWLLEGCLKWQQSGLTIPAAVQEMKAEYRQEQDVLSDFLATHCFIGTGFQATAKDIYARYEHWCEMEGIKPISSTMMGKRLKEKGLVSHRKNTGKEWHGIKLKDVQEK